ncbi:hypothetical protein C8J57DRAFT_1233977 [Mycena rebaudengoi]|nr:hypothetical protein C8J57DRAFT_1233977 [Mycena rebaudengoi]
MSEVLEAGNHDLYIHGKFRLWLRFWQGPNFPRSLRDFDWLAIGKQSMGRGYVCDDYVWVIHIVVQLKGGVQVSTNALCVESSPHISGSGSTLFSTGSMVQINDLPVEVLSWALKIAVEYLVAGWPMYAFELAGLRSVCRYWNDVLLGDSTLWCRLYIDPWTPMQRVVKWIERSRGCSLFIYLNITRGWPSAAIVPSLSYSPSAFVDAVFDIIGASFRRCVHLYAASKDADATTRFSRRLSTMDASVLRTLHLRLFPDYVALPRALALLDGDLTTGIATPVILDDGAPRLRCLTLQRCLLSNTAGYGFCRNLVELRLQDMWDPIDVRQSELYAVIKSVPRLTRLHLIFVDCIAFEDAAVETPVLADLIHLEFTPVSVGSCRLLGCIAMPKLETLVLSIHPSQLVVPVVSICRPAFRTVAIAALTLRGATSMEFNALMCSMPCLRRLDCRKSGSGISDGLLEIGSGIYGLFSGLSLVVAHSRTRAGGLEFARSLLTGGVFASGLEVILSIGQPDESVVVKYNLEGLDVVATSIDLSLYRFL